MLPSVSRKLREYAEATDSTSTSPVEPGLADNTHACHPEYVEPSNADDAWKAILGPVMSNEREATSVTPQESVQSVHSQPSTQASSPVDDSTVAYQNTFIFTLPEAEPREQFCPVERMNRIIQELPQDRATLLVLLQRTHSLSSQIQERLYSTNPPWGSSHLTAVQPAVNSSNNGFNTWTVSAAPQQTFGPFSSYSTHTPPAPIQSPFSPALPF